MTLDTIVQEYGAERFVEELGNKLRSGTYRSQPARQKEIPKPDGKKRPLGIPVIADRVVQMAAKMVMEPIFEADYRLSQILLLRKLIYLSSKSKSL
ncbi:hypothetical protein ACX12E_04140 [Paenibacillus vandeheii]